MNVWHYDGNTWCNDRKLRHAWIWYPPERRPWMKRSNNLQRSSIFVEIFVHLGIFREYEIKIPRSFFRWSNCMRGVTAREWVPESHTLRGFRRDSDIVGLTGGEEVSLEKCEEKAPSAVENHDCYCWRNQGIRFSPRLNVRVCKPTLCETWVLEEGTCDAHASFRAVLYIWASEDGGDVLLEEKN